MLFFAKDIVLKIGLKFILDKKIDVLTKENVYRNLILSAVAAAMGVF
jgi:hypothetical protein